MNKKRRRWLLRRLYERPFGDSARGHDKRDVVPWSTTQRSEKPYQSGSTGPAVRNEGDSSYPANSNYQVGEGTLQTYMGTPGSDYKTLQHGT